MQGITSDLMLLLKVLAPFPTGDAQWTDGGWGITLLFIGLVLVVAAVMIATELRFQGGVVRRLGALNRKLARERHDAGEGWSFRRAGDLDAFLERIVREVPELAHGMQELRQACFEFTENNGEGQKRQIFATQPTEDFVDVPTLRFHSSWWFAPPALQMVAPSMLMAIGIFGTFVGLVAGLPTASELSATAVAALLAGLQISFRTSVWGLFTSLILTATQRSVTGTAERHVRTFVDMMDSRLQLGAQQHLLNRMHVQQERLADSIETLNTDLSIAVQDALGMAVEEHLAPAFARMEDHSESIKSLAQQLVEASAEKQMKGVDLLVTKVMEQMDAAIGGSMREAGEMLLKFAEQQKINTEAAGVAAARFETAATTLGASTEAQRTLLGQWNESLGSAERVAADFRVAAEKIHDSLDSVTGTLEKFEHLHDLMATTIASQADIGARSVGKTEELMADATSRFEDMLGSWQQMQGAVSDAVSSISGQLTDGVSALEGASKHLTVAASGATAALSTVNDVMSAQTAAQRAMLESFQRAGEAVDKLRPVSDALDQASERFSEAGSFASGVVSQLGGVVSQQREVAEEQKQTIAAMHKRMEDLRNDLGELIDRFSSVSTDMTDGLQGFVGRFPDAIDAFLHDVDRALAESVSRLASHTSELGLQFDELGDRLEEILPPDNQRPRA